MNQTGVTILKKHFGDFFVRRENGCSYVLFIVPYRPFSAYPAKCGSIDAYYFTSHAAYRKCISACEELRKCGIEADHRVNLNLKEQLSAVPGVSVADNTLCFNREAGTRFVIGSIRAEVGLEPSERCEKTNGCLHCGKCATACPTGAIASSGFIRERCLRQHMEQGGGWDDEISQKLGMRILGCDVCQRVCPLNEQVADTPPSERVIQLTSLQDLYESLCNRDTKELAGEIGANYARRGKLINLVVNAMGNSGNAAYLPALRKAAEGAEEGNRLRAIKKLEGN